jgi:hypothetical protein
MEPDKNSNTLQSVEKMKKRTELFKLLAAVFGFASQVLRLFF